jgi:hypothetical protein
MLKIHSRSGSAYTMFGVFGSGMIFSDPGPTFLKDNNKAQTI